MNIVVINDDGWGTAGIRLLAREMTKLGAVTVIAPAARVSVSAAAIPFAVFCIMFFSPLICLCSKRSRAVRCFEVFISLTLPSVF